MSHIKYFIAGYCLLFLVPLSAQVSFKQDMNNVQKHLGAAHIRFTLQYTMYATHSGTDNQVQQMHADYYLWDDMYAYRTDELHLLTNDKMTLSVDKEQQLVMINKYDPAYKRKKLMELTEIITDSLRDRVIKDSLLQSSNEERTWRILFKTPVKGVAFIDVSIQLPEYRITKMTQYYSRSFKDIFEDAPDGVSLQSKPRLEIAFTEYRELLAADKQKYFSGEDVVKLDASGKAVLASPYRSYKLSNFYNLKK